MILVIVAVLWVLTGIYHSWQLIQIEDTLWYEKILDTIQCVIMGPIGVLLSIFDELVILNEKE